jgi:hypothetical protein
VKAIITEKWNGYLEKFNASQKDIYYYEEYVRLYESADGKALCVVCYDDNNILLMPFIRGAIEDYYDFETPYGYGGPIANTDSREWINTALEEMKSILEREKYVCGFIRFHPILDNVDICKSHMQTYFDRNTIEINTSISGDDIWNNQISSKCRNMVRKAEKNGLLYKAEYEFQSLTDFKTLYNITMHRLDADAFYYFDDEYYESFVNAFKNKAFLGTVRKDGRLICASLFMYSHEYGHYHLEGSNPDYLKFGANNMLLWETAKEFNRLGVKRFHLGGGTDSSPDDSLFKFKKSFSCNFDNFYIGKWIYNEEKYNELRKNWMENNPDKVGKYGNRLLCYRY